MGKALNYADRSRDALLILERGLLLARERGDRFAEKLGLEYLGQAYACLREPAPALAHFEQTPTLASATGDRKQQADLLWQMAVLQAEAGRSDWARAHARSSVDLLEETQDPRASVFAEHLTRYSFEAFPADSAGRIDPAACRPCTLRE